MLTNAGVGPEVLTAVWTSRGATVIVCAARCTTHTAIGGAARARTRVVSAARGIGAAGSTSEGAVITHIARVISVVTFVRVASRILRVRQSI